MTEKGVIRLVTFDLDETLWTMHGKGHASLLVPPYTKLRDDELVDAEKKRLTLHKDAFKIIDALNKKKILMSAISANDKDKVLLALEHFDLKKQFHFPQIDWEDKDRGTCNKAALLNKLLSLLKVKMGKDFKYSEILFVDDRISNIDRVRALGVNCLHFTSFNNSLFDVFKFFGSKEE